MYELEEAWSATKKELRQDLSVVSALLAIAVAELLGLEMIHPRNALTGHAWISIGGSACTFALALVLVYGEERFLSKLHRIHGLSR